VCVAPLLDRLDELLRGERTSYQEALGHRPVVVRLSLTAGTIIRVAPFLSGCRWCGHNVRAGGTVDDHFDVLQRRDLRPAISARSRCIGVLSGPSALLVRPRPDTH
jgi:hypothetical protein